MMKYEDIKVDDPISIPGTDVYYRPLAITSKGVWAAEKFSKSNNNPRGVVVLEPTVTWYPYTPIVERKVFMNLYSGWTSGPIVNPLYNSMVEANRGAGTYRVGVIEYTMLGDVTVDLKLHKLVDPIDPASCKSWGRGG